MSPADRNPWPELPPLDQWQGTFETLHRWTQILGKIRLAHAPWTNHSWHVPLYLTARGLTTSPVFADGRAFELELDLVGHQLCLSTSEGDRDAIGLEGASVAGLYRELNQRMRKLGIETSIWTIPVEIPGDVAPFEKDERAAYDPQMATRLLRALLQMQRVLAVFRSRFIGKVSPIHFFWGAFDLAVTRFSGRTAPAHPGGAPNCADWIMREAYSHEVSSAGFWAGTGFGEPAFYSYAYPGPEGFAKVSVEPSEAFYLEEMGEYVLPYAAVRAASNPDATLLDFLQTTYEAAADLANWDRAALERERLTPKE